MSQFRWLGQSADGESVTLRRYHGEFAAPAYATPEWFTANPESWRVGAVLDVETTGMSHQSDKIIEIGIRAFRFHRDTGEILARDEGYGELQDPGEPLSPEITRITGITDAMVQGKQIDWTRAHALLDKAQIVIAHNASFDRPFVDKICAISGRKIWGCSFRYIDWRQKGFPSQKLEILAIYHGFFNDAHRALADADTVLHLLQMPDPNLGTPYFKELLGNARRRSALVIALNSPYETKSLLRERGYRWNSERKVWMLSLYADECETEKEWLTRNVYGGVFGGLVRELSLTDGFKPLSTLLGEV